MKSANMQRGYWTAVALLSGLLSITHGQGSITFQRPPSDDTVVNPFPNTPSHITLMCIVNEKGIFEWRWKKGEQVFGDIDPGRQSARTIDPLQYSDAGTYTCEVRRSGESRFHESRSQQLILQAYISSSDSVNGFTNVGSVNLTCELNGYLREGSDAVWFKEGDSNPLQSNSKYTIITMDGSQPTQSSSGVSVPSVVSVLTINMLETGDSGRYICRDPSSGVESNTTLSVDGNVVPPPPTLANSSVQPTGSITFQHPPSSNTVVDPFPDTPHQITLTCSVNEMGTYEWRWKKGGQVIGDIDPGRQNARTIDSLQYSDAGTYTCEVRRRGESRFNESRSQQLILQAYINSSDSVSGSADVGSVNLTCELSGYLREGSDAVWFKEGDSNPLQSNVKHTIVTMDGSQPTQSSSGVSVPSVVSVLTINMLETGDSGRYICRDPSSGVESVTTLSVEGISGTHTTLEGISGIHTTVVVASETLLQVEVTTLPQPRQSFGMPVLAGGIAVTVALVVVAGVCIAVGVTGVCVAVGVAVYCRKKRNSKTLCDNTIECDSNEAYSTTTIDLRVYENLKPHEIAARRLWEENPYSLPEDSEPHYSVIPEPVYAAIA